MHVTRFLSLNAAPCSSRSCREWNEQCWICESDTPRSRAIFRRVAHSRRNNSISCGEGCDLGRKCRGKLKQRDHDWSLADTRERAVNKRRSEFCVRFLLACFKNAFCRLVWIRSASRMIPIFGDFRRAQLKDASSRDANLIDQICPRARGRVGHKNVGCGAKNFSGRSRMFKDAARRRVATSDYPPVQGT